MATWISLQPNLISRPYTRSRNPIFPGTRIGGFSVQTRPFRSSVVVAQFGFRPGFLPDPSDSVDSVKELFGRAESLLYTIADAAVSSSDAVSTTSTTKQNSDWLSGIANYMETVLKVLQDGLSTLHVPYAYGFAIILLTMLVKAATFPLTKKQVESAMAMRSLQPQIKAIQERYAGNQEKIQLETARLYKLAGINPLAGCLPTLATIPVWIGLYRALSNVADEGFLTEGFFWIPSLAGPTTVAARQNGSGISWLFPFIDGQPPLGWSDTLAYLVLPLLLVVSQYISVQIMQSSQNNDPNMKNSQVITKVLPLMIGYFSLSVPSGLSLYWLTNNILSTAQQVYLQKFGGAKNTVPTFPDKIKEQKSQVQKSVSELKTVREELKEVKKSTPGGPRPGERFRQLKEQEARRKQKIEEERRKAEEAVITANQNLAEQQNEEATLVDNEIQEKNHVVKGQDSPDAELTVNGKVSALEMTEKHSEVSTSDEAGRNSEYQSNENVKEEYTIVTETDQRTKKDVEEAEIN